MDRAATCLALSCLMLAGCLRIDRWTGSRCADGGSWCEEVVQTGEDAAFTSPDAAGDAQFAEPDSSCGVCDAGEPIVRDGYCVAGHYIGHGKLDYRPGAAGACGLFTIFGGTGEGEWQFSITKDDSEHYAVSANICMREVSDAGALEGDGAVGDAGAVIAGQLTIRGVMDCATGRLTSTVRGMYRAPSLCTLGALEDDYYYRGSMTADVDLATNMFWNGELIVRERDPNLGIGDPPGGEGTWNAERVASPRAEDQPALDCFGDASFPEQDFADAGP